ncbi:hypothetical protein MesoLjLc_16370 [Mesorhizobium sp. L-8-10]|nr:hypothetical protein MesoLjLb_17980 [Mesorhizobium sp. L-8-3]BCH29707.1 hypothetical protein MesoLjLc_16370 [Mesorhizobium sp. L-8-10]
MGMRPIENNQVLLSEFMERSPGGRRGFDPSTIAGIICATDSFQLTITNLLYNKDAIVKETEW